MSRALAEAYCTLQEAVMHMGKFKVATLASAVNIAAEITLKQRRVMGMRLPVVETTFVEHPPYYSPMGTSFWIDGSINEFKEALQLMGRLAELQSSVLFIQNRLEENERDMFVLMKMVKNRLLVRKGGS